MGGKERGKEGVRVDGLVCERREKGRDRGKMAGREP